MKINKSDLIYVEESILLDDLFKLSYQPSIVKNASVYDELGLSSIFSSLVQYFKDALHWDDDNVPGGRLVKLLNLITPSLLLRANPFIGGLYLLSTSLFGIDLIDIIKTIISKFKTNIEEGKPISTSELQSSSSGLSSSAFKEELILLIKEAYKENNLIKEDRGRGRSYYFYYNNKDFLQFPWMFTDRRLGLLQRLLDNLTKLRGKKLIWGFAMWIVKSIFLSLGLLAVGGTAAKMLGVNSAKPKLDSEQTKHDSSSNILTNNIQQSQHKLTHSSDVWIVPLVGNKTVEDTLRIWTLDLYPELEQNPEINDIIYKSNKFREMVRLLKSDYKKLSSKYLVMPENFKSRKQVVDQFIDDVKRNVK